MFLLLGGIFFVMGLVSVLMISEPNDSERSDEVGGKNYY